MFCTNCGKEIPNESQFCTFCGNKVKGKEAQDNKTQTTNNSLVNVTFHRKKRFTGCAVSMKIHVDNTVVAVLGNGDTKQVQVPSGKHKVVIEMWSAISETEVEFLPGYSNIYVEVGLKMGLLTNKTKILSIRNEE